MVAGREVVPSARAGEREAVIGDIAKSGATGGEAVRDVFDLIVRRNWRVWLALAALTVQAWALADFHVDARSGFRHLVEVRRTN